MMGSGKANASLLSTEAEIAKRFGVEQQTCDRPAPAVTPFHFDGGYECRL